MAKGRENSRPAPGEGEAPEKGRKCGLKRGAARREKRSLRQCLETLMELPSEERPDLTNREAAALVLLQKALRGEVSAFNALRDSLGEKPADKKEISGPEGAPIELEHGATPEVAAFLSKLRGE